MSLLDIVSPSKPSMAQYGTYPFKRPPIGSTGLTEPAMGTPQISLPQESGTSLMGYLGSRPKALDTLAALSQMNSQADGLADQKAKAVAPIAMKSGNKAIDIASTQLGSPYIWADMNPQGKPGGPGSGFDCSGLTKWVYSKMGIELPHSAAQQKQMATPVGRNGLQPGMLVFFNYGRLGPSQADHVGIYIGNGKMIAASSSQDKVVVQPVDWSHFFGGGYFR